MDQGICIFTAPDALLFFPDSGMLPNAVLPPYSDHIYAQWKQPEELTPTANRNRTSNGSEKTGKTVSRKELLAFKLLWVLRLGGLWLL